MVCVCICRGICCFFLQFGIQDDRTFVDQFGLYNTMECGTSVKSDNSFRFDCSHTSHAAYNRVDLVLIKT
jgi:hypothetical protein